MKNKTNISLWAITLLLCAPATKAMHQRKPASSSCITTPLATAVSPYETMSLEDLTENKTRLEEQAQRLNAQIKHKKDHEWPEQNPCCNCLVGTKTQIATSGCATLSCVPIFPLYVKAPPLPQDPPLFCLDNITCLFASMASTAIFGIYSGIAHSIHDSATETFTKTDREEKTNIEEELSKVDELINALTTANRQKEAEIWKAYQTRKLKKLQKRD